MGLWLWFSRQRGLFLTPEVRSLNPVILKIHIEH